MRIRCVLADPAGNLTALALTPVAHAHRPAVGALLMRETGAEQTAFVDENSLFAEEPRMEMMGGEFCGNATRAFALYAAIVRGQNERALRVRVSGAKEPVRVSLDVARAHAFAQMPLPYALEEMDVRGRRVRVVHMPGIVHAIVQGEHPSLSLAEAVLFAMPKADAQGVLFAREGEMTPLVYVPATGTRVWESSCGSGTAALSWLLARGLPDGKHAFSFKEPGGVIKACVVMRGGRAEELTMGGAVRLSAEKVCQTRDDPPA